MTSPTIISILLILGGFAFGRQDAPKGDEWQNPQALSLNKEYPHAWFFSFQDTESARKVLPENSTLWMTLNGEWSFNWVANPEERPQDFYKPGYDVSSWDMIPVPSNWNVVGLGKDGSQKYGTPIYVNVNVPFYHEVEVDDWRKGVMRTPPEDWTMYKARNEVGSYRRNFTLPANWSGKQVFINFDGVDSFFYLWINGKYVGFSKNSRNTAQFNITDYLSDGENVLAVEVYRNSDGSHFEAQDMFRLPGIFRTVALEAKPSVNVRNIRITPGMTELKVEAEVSGTTDCTLDYHLYELGLYKDDNVLVKDFPGQQQNCTLAYAEAKPWSAEAPYRYVLVGELKDASGKVLDIFSTYTGFREVTIRDTAAEDDEFGLEGRYFYLNGKPVKLRGVNRHETWPDAGHAVTREMMQEDVFLMKRANINHVRDSHYPDDPYWYCLCDKYGIYLMDEANIESHHYHYGDASLSNVPEFRDAHVARMSEMVCQNYNHPCILIWSMGNEAGPGINFKYTYDAARALDPMRPIQYERNNDISDIGCRQYPAVKWVENVASGKADVKYPYHINEFAHSMGNALGDFADYWKWMDSNNYFMGGCIWDWVDQSLYNWTKDGVRYLASGGNFGDKPNDGQFVMNGILFGDREPKPQYFEVKKVYQTLYSSFQDEGVIEVFNRNYYEASSCLCKWEVIADGEPFNNGSFDTGEIAARGSKNFNVPYGKLPKDKECYLNVCFCEKEDLPWAEAGYESSKDQLFLQASAAPAEQTVKGRSLKVVETADNIRIKGKGFRMEFDKTRGTISSLRYRRTEVVSEGEGPSLDVFRAVINNDTWVYDKWFRNGLHNLRPSAESVSLQYKEDGSVVIECKVCCKAPNGARMTGTPASPAIDVEEHPEMKDVMSFSLSSVWTVCRNGRIDFTSKIVPDRDDVSLGKMGFIMKVPQALSNFRYYGRGPVENYPDRYTSAFVGIYGSTVKEQVTNYTKPQEMSNHEQVRWASLTDRRGRGVVITAKDNSLNASDSQQAVMSVSAIPYKAEELLKASHQYLLPEAGDTYLSIDAAVLGLGGASCGPAPQEQYKLYSKPLVFGFSISPAKGRR